MEKGDSYIDAIVDRVLERLTAGASGTRPAPSTAGDGLFDTLDEAARAAAEAFRAFSALPLEARRRTVAAVRRAAVEGADELSRLAVAETGMGRVEDKVRKNVLAAEKTPGPEILDPDAVTGDHGLTLTDRAPYGVIGSITPSTNPSETIIHNGISMMAGGNAVVFNGHPGAKETTARTIVLLNRAIHDAGGPPFLFTAVREPTIETAQALMTHPGIRLLVVTGGPGVVAAAMRSGKRVVAAGPGNPPAVVDETADVERAGKDLVLGSSLDNNIICVDEKEVICVAAVADRLRDAMVRAGAHLLEPNRLEALEKLVLAENAGPGRHGAPRKEWVGRDASRILDALGVPAAGDPRIVLVETEPDHPFVWTELLMPVIPLCRVPDVDAAIDLAVRVEQGFGHTASMHSRNLDALSRMARAVNTSIFVKNGPNYSGLGFGGEGHTSFTIASPTGEGLTDARTFTRPRRCVLVDRFRIV
ncbi:MAG: aldehyde dehydrogenase EutE [Candidatus Eisenbacteria bacterium]|nr:aldehyde dehydrogenase EutE [Candidatus Eisenbacteria bacterium]